MAGIGDITSKFEDHDEPKYTTFRRTYRIITFAMGIGMVYPEPSRERRRIMCSLIAILTILPISIMVLIEMYESWKTSDYINIIRHSTIVGPFLGGFFKMLVMHYKRISAKAILDEIDRDYAIYNTMPDKYQAIIDTSITNNLFYCEKCWSIIVTTCVLTFPLMALIQTLYSSIYKAEPTKYMIHDFNIPFCDPELRLESPYFEMLNIYMLYCVIFYIVNYTGYDGFFGLAVNHACLKMDLYCKLFEDAMREKDRDQMYKKVVNVVIEQNRMYEYVDLIQDSFNIWLGMILAATIVQICTCMYHITEGFELDLRYIILMMGTVAHIFLPCRYSTKLKFSSVETATTIYCGGWENMSDKRVRKMIPFMIARAQIPVNITACNLLIFDMDLFVAIMKSSYSMYTLLRS